MMAIAGHPRPAERREAKKVRYREQRVGACIAKMIVIGPAEHVPELCPILPNWRRDAKLLLESDVPSAGQILQIDGVCRILRIKLPVNALEAPAIAEARPLAQQPRPGARRVHVPKRRSQPRWPPPKS